MEKLDAPITDPRRRRDLRALELLERIGTATARDLLHDLAQGAPEARFTRDAREAYQRLSKHLQEP